jgi:hypothetical protein
MSYDMQASGFNSNASLTLIYANHDWSDAPQNPVLWVAAFGPTMPGVSDGSPNRDLDAVFAWGNFAGNGVIGWGGYKTGSGVVGVPGAATGDFDLVKARGKNIGVYGAAAGTNPAIGVLGEGGSGSPGVVGHAGTGNADGVQGFGAGNFSGVAGFGDSKSNGTGVFGQGGGPHAQGVRGIGGGGPNTSPFDAAGVYGQAGAGNANGVEGRGSGNFAGVAGFGDVSNGANSGIGVFAVGGAPQPGSGHFGGPGVYAVGNGGPGYVQINQPLGVYGVGGGDNAPGIFGIGAGGPAFTPVSQAAGVYGIGGSGNAAGVVGQGGSLVGDGVQGFSPSGNGVSGESGDGVGVRATSTSSTGLVAVGTTGLFASSSAPGGTAGQFDGNLFVVNGNFTVTGGVKSVAVPFPDGSHRRLYCVESPENWFEDFGFGELSNGEAQVQLEEGFRSVVNSDAYHVFITEYGDHNALYVAERTSTSFLVRAKASKADGTFSYRVVAKRRDVAAPRFDKVDLQSALQGTGDSPGQPEPVVPIAA